MLYDVHTYKNYVDTNVNNIVNYTIDDSFERNINYSVGVHPWRIANDAFKNLEFDYITELATKDNVLAIGECGLDKLHPAMERQILFFEKHIALANRLDKPLIIHCVQSFERVAQLLRKANVPVIIHGVNNKIEKLKPFLDQGFYFSFGSTLLQEQSIARQSLLSIPIRQLLFETDDAEISISEIYHCAADLRKISFEELNLQVEQNVKKIFGWE